MSSNHNRMTKLVEQYYPSFKIRKSAESISIDLDDLFGGAEPQKTIRLQFVYSRNIGEISILTETNYKARWNRSNGATEVVDKCFEFGINKTPAAPEKKQTKRRK